MNIKRKIESKKNQMELIEVKNTIYEVKNIMDLPNSN